MLHAQILRYISTHPQHFGEFMCAHCESVYCYSSACGASAKYLSWHHDTHGARVTPIHPQDFENFDDVCTL